MYGKIVFDGTLTAEITSIRLTNGRLKLEAVADNVKRKEIPENDTMIPAVWYDEDGKLAVAYKMNTAKLFDEVTPGCSMTFHQEIEMSNIVFL